MSDIKHGKIEKIINGGWGLVRSDEGVVFINYVLPGEDVSFRIKEKANGILWGELIQLHSLSPHRVEPPCPYYGECGGCVFQHINYNYQETIKKEILTDDLLRIGNFQTEIPPFFLSPPYQNRIRARMKAQPDGKIGFIRKGTNTVIPIDKCLLFPDSVNTFLSQWNALPHPPFFHQLDILANRHNNRLYVHLSHTPHQEKEFLKNFPNTTFSWKGNEDAAVSSFSIKDFSYLVSPSAFFQVNPFQWENMLNTVESFLEPCEKVIDLYSGVGFFIPLLHRYAKHVIGVESTGFAVTLARRAFSKDGIQLIATAAEKFSFPRADVILVDPPRSGLCKRVMNSILQKKYPKIIFISCASATFARDLKTLHENGYKLREIRGFDLFPQTPHMETISLFTQI